MIPDDTLAAWEKADYVPGELLLAIAEIRRLQNELANRDYVEWRRAYDSDLGKRIDILSQTLSAHRAAVRELADLLERRHK